MDGIATLLDPISQERVAALWQRLQLRCEFPPLRSYLIPHLTWHVAESYDHEALTRILEDLCGQFEPFFVRTAGLGIFTGERPILFIQVIKDQFLIDFHRRLWEIFTPLAKQPSLHYSPENWMPHVTLFFDDLFLQPPPVWDAYQTTLCILNLLIRETFDWQIQVANLSYGRVVDDQMQFRDYPFNPKDCQ